LNRNHEGGEVSRFSFKNKGFREGGQWFSPIMHHGVSTKKFQGFSGRMESVFSRPSPGVPQEEVQKKPQLGTKQINIYAGGPRRVPSWGLLNKHTCRNLDVSSPIRDIDPES
jgi:hypothetical protein